RPTCLKFSSLMGREVQSQSGKRLGEVLDLVVSLDINTPPICIVGNGSAPGLRETHVAVPLHALRWSADSGVLALATTRQMFWSSTLAPSGEWEIMIIHLMEVDIKPATKRGLCWKRCPRAFGIQR